MCIKKTWYGIKSQSTCRSLRMTLIEGVGDEVVQFVAALVVAAVGALAWWSTNARPDRYRTVLVMRSRAHHPVTVSIRPRKCTNLLRQTGNTNQYLTHNLRSIIVKST